VPAATDSHPLVALGRLEGDRRFGESFDVVSMKDRASWDDEIGLSKDTRGLFHERNRKCGRD